MSLKATLILTGGSLLKQDAPETIEIQAIPMNLSSGGVGLALTVKASWGMIAPQKELDLFLERGADRQMLKGRVTHLKEDDQYVGVEFLNPLQDMSRFIVPTEMQP